MIPCCMLLLSKSRIAFQQKPINSSGNVSVLSPGGWQKTQTTHCNVNAPVNVTEVVGNIITLLITIAHRRLNDITKQQFLHLQLSIREKSAKVFWNKNKV